MKVGDLVRRAWPEDQDTTLGIVVVVQPIPQKAKNEWLNPTNLKSWQKKFFDEDDCWVDVLWADGTSNVFESDELQLIF